MNHILRILPIVPNQAESGSLYIEISSYEGWVTIKRGNEILGDIRLPAIENKTPQVLAKIEIFSGETEETA